MKSPEITKNALFRIAHACHVQIQHNKTEQTENNMKIQLGFIGGRYDAGVGSNRWLVGYIIPNIGIGYTFVDVF